MKIKRFTADTMQGAMQQVRSTLGDDAVILSSNSNDLGVEIVAAVDYDEKLLDKRPTAGAPRRGASEPATAINKTTNTNNIITKQADSINQSSHKQTGTNSASALYYGLSASEEQQDKNSGLHDNYQPVNARARGALLANKNRHSHAIDDNQLTSIQTQLDNLATLVVKQTENLAWQNQLLTSADKTQVLARLANLGLSSDICLQISDKIVCNSSTEQNWHNALTALEVSLLVSDDDLLERGGLVAFVGATGVGKTTSVAKLAARYVLNNSAKSLGLITLDSYRIGATDQLQTYGKIIGVPVHRVENREQLERVLAKLCDKHLILIDTAGLSQRDPRFNEQLKLLDEVQQNICTTLVVSANAQAAVIEQTVKLFKPLHCQHCIISKLDECANLGEVLSILMQYGLTIAYMSAGQRVPEDLHRASREAIVDLLITMSSEYLTPLSDTTLAQMFAKGEQHETV